VFSFDKMFHRQDGPAHWANARLVRYATARNKGCLAVPRMVEDMNRQLRGWKNYFSYGYPRKAFRRLNAFVEWRLYRQLKRRSQRPFKCPEGQSFHKHLGILGWVPL
jgi:RNA-directed DNA polymerase